jgi:hypothetical protein
MPPGDRLQGPLQRFAAEAIGLDPEQDESATRTTLFLRLRDHDFLPDPLQHQAILALAGRAVVAGSTLLEEVAEAEERRLHAEVEQYAAEFFEVPVASRVDRYRLLGQACAQHPRLIERLRLLRPGLMIDRVSLTDASPLVKQLLYDILDLFPLRPDPRAAEARARVSQIQADPGSNDADRARAVKALTSRHREVVALLPDFPARLGKVRRRASADRWLAKVVEKVAEPREPLRRSYVIMAVILLSGVFRLANSLTKPTSVPITPSSFQTPENIPSPRMDPSRIPAYKAEVASALVRFNRDEMKAAIRRELVRVGKPLAEPELNRVAAELPVEELPPVGGMGTIILQGRWTQPLRDRFVAALKAALKATKLGLTDAALDDLAPRCFPKPTSPGKP